MKTNHKDHVLCPVCRASVHIDAISDTADDTEQSVREVWATFVTDGCSAVDLDHELGDLGNGTVGIVTPNDADIIDRVYRSVGWNVQQAASDLAGFGLL